MGQAVLQGALDIAGQGSKPSINGGLASMPAVQSGFAMASNSQQAAALHQQQQVNRVWAVEFFPHRACKILELAVCLSVRWDTVTLSRATFTDFSSSLYSLKIITQQTCFPSPGNRICSKKSLQTALTSKGATAVGGLACLVTRYLREAI